MEMSNAQENLSEDSICSFLDNILDEYKKSNKCNDINVTDNSQSSRWSACTATTTMCEPAKSADYWEHFNYEIKTNESTDLMNI